MSKKNEIKKSTELQQFDNFVIFQTENDKVNIDVYFQDETLWLTQKRIAELFEKDRTVITKHLKNIFESGELIENSVCANFAHTAKDGKTVTEIIYTEADAKKIYMSLKVWKQAPDGKILKSDVTIAKNYLNNEQHNYGRNQIQ